MLPRSSVVTLRAFLSRPNKIVQPTKQQVSRLSYHAKGNGGNGSILTYSSALAGIAAVATFSEWNSKYPNSSNISIAQCEPRIATSDFGMIGPTSEPETGILFPRLCNALTFVGCGVRVKWRFVKVYAVGTYVDPIAMNFVKNQSNAEIEKALLDPQYPRTIRIVMARNLSIDKYTSAIVEALKPRMKGEDLDKLDEFKKLNPPVDLVEGAVMEMTIRGDTLLYRNSAGSVGAIHSDIFCRAMCDVYYGDDAVSPTHKENVIKGIKSI
eukprot:CAMPEP_0195516924 /NCGR_PEP_ID=MMETSP0794_2-20130614/9160_1 /TAXON_ID=515487 /ORGANISM="Stephanopyxis turris, Strain CCMP 815" /LENGTH=267 /DNA_ID=CAMNT_0040645641 /DNA_START=68 /DNA_END=871 /DNA_ORIENTATION=-